MKISRFFLLNLSGKGSPSALYLPFLHFNQKVSAEEDNEGNEPSWEKQEAMVRRLQKKFPDQDKEVKTQRHVVPVCNALSHFMLRFILVRSDSTLSNYIYSR